MGSDDCGKNVYVRVTAVGVIRVQSVLQRKSPGLRGRCLVLVLALPLACYVTLGKALPLSGP